MKAKRAIIRLLGLRIWDAISGTRKLKMCCYKKLFGLENNVSIHSHVVINAHHSCVSIFPRIGKCGISVGKDCVFNDNVSIDLTGNVAIGDRVLLAEDVIIYTHTHRIPNMPKEHTEATTLLIEDDVFVGARTIILSSCHYIGKRVRIGAGAVVTKDIPDYAIAVGVPAKVVGYGEC